VGASTTDLDSQHNMSVNLTLNEAAGASTVVVADEKKKKTKKSVLADYIVTTTNNYISRNASLIDPHTIELQGQSIVYDGVQLQGPIKISRYCVLHPNTILEPARTVSSSSNDTQKGDVVVPMAIGPKTHIGNDCRIHAAAIGSFCWIGDHVTIGARCILKDCVIVADHTVLPPDTVVPPFFYLKSSGVRVELPPSASMEWEEHVMDYYHRFVKELLTAGSQ
jgi:dynactin 5